MSADDRWRPRGEGPVVRPYAVTGGRTEPVDGEPLDLLAVVVAVRRPADGGEDDDGLRLAQERLNQEHLNQEHSVRLTPEHRRILTVCRRRITVADVAADVGLPVGVVRVLLADLIKGGAVMVMRQRPAAEQASNDMLQEILNGLRAL